MIFAVFGAFLIICIILFLISDHILYVQHERHFESWEADGKPTGIFYSPKEAKTVFGLPRFGSWISGQKRHLTLLFRTPPWAQSEPSTRTLLIVFRLLWVIAVLLWFGFAFLTLKKNRYS